MGHNSQDPSKIFKNRYQPSSTQLLKAKDWLESKSKEVENINISIEEVG
jgi:hypothetical protein